MTGAVVFWRGRSRLFSLIVRGQSSGRHQQEKHLHAWTNDRLSCFLARTVSHYSMAGNNSRRAVPLSSQGVIGLVKWSSQTQTGWRWCSSGRGCQENCFMLVCATAGGRQLHRPPLSSHFPARRVSLALGTRLCVCVCVCVCVAEPVHVHANEVQTWRHQPVCAC